MSAECQRCSGQAHNAFICHPCQDELQELLNGLWRGQLLPSGHYAPGWISYLEDAAHGQTRLGVSVRRSTELSGPLPFNERASELLDQATETLQRWVAAVNLNHEQLGEQ